MEDVTMGKRGSSYPALKRLAQRPGDDAITAFQLPAHAELNLSSAQSAEIIAEHFSSISQEYQPLDLSLLPPNIQGALRNCNQKLAPRLSVSDVHAQIIRAKKPNGLVPGDLPKRLVKFCSAELAYPVTLIFNNISTSAVYPKLWKEEHQIAIPKVHPPETEDDLRDPLIK